MSINTGLCGCRSVSHAIVPGFKKTLCMLTTMLKPHLVGDILALHQLPDQLSARTTSMKIFLNKFEMSLSSSWADLSHLISSVPAPPSLGLLYTPGTALLCFHWVSVCNISLNNVLVDQSSLNLPALHTSPGI